MAPSAPTHPRPETRLRMGRRKDKPHPGVHRPGRPIPGESHDDYSLPEDETSGGGGKPGKKG